MRIGTPLHDHVRFVFVLPLRPGLALRPRRPPSNSLIARRTEFWWNPKRPDERVLWNGAGSGSRALLRPLPRWGMARDLVVPSPARHRQSPLVDTQVLKDKAINEGRSPLPLRYVRLRFPSGK